jgi:hypothetical protein
MSGTELDEEERMREEELAARLELFSRLGNDEHDLLNQSK